MWSYHPNLKDSKSIMTTCIGHPEATNNLKINNICNVYYSILCFWKVDLWIDGCVKRLGDSICCWVFFFAEQIPIT